jgi:hypothetical protein
VSNLICVTESQVLFVLSSWLFYKFFYVHLFLYRRIEGCMRLMDWKICRSKLYRRYRCPCGLWRRSAAARPLKLRVRNSPGSWMFVCYECCVLSGRGPCDELITVPEESYWVWCVILCDLETSRMKRPLPALGRSTTRKKEVEQVCWVCIRPIAKIILTRKHANEAG